MTARAVTAVGLGGLTVLITVVQFATLVAASRKGRGFSFVPFIPALLGVAACLVAPWRGSLWLLPVAFVLDPTPIMFLFVLLTGRLSRKAV